MDLLRDWRRRTFGAAAGAVVAPVAIVLAALAVGVGGGGLSGLQSIGQAVSGPAVSPIAPQADRDRDTADSAGRLLARVRPGRRGGSTALAQTNTAGAGGSAPATRRQGTVRRPRPQAQRPTASPPTAAPAQPPVQPPSSPTPNPTQSPVKQLGDTVKSVTDQVPVAGEPVGEVVDLLVDTVDSLPPLLAPH